MSIERESFGTPYTDVSKTLLVRPSCLSASLWTIETKNNMISWSIHICFYKKTRAQTIDVLLVLRKRSLKFMWIVLLFKKPYKTWLSGVKSMTSRSLVTCYLHNSILQTTCITFFFIRSWWKLIVVSKVPSRWFFFSWLYDATSFQQIKDGVSILQTSTPVIFLRVWTCQEGSIVLQRRDSVLSAWWPEKILSVGKWIIRGPWERRRWLNRVLKFPCSNFTSISIKNNVPQGEIAEDGEKVLKNCLPLSRPTLLVLFKASNRKTGLSNQILFTIEPLYGLYLGIIKLDRECTVMCLTSDRITKNEARKGTKAFVQIRVRVLLGLILLLNAIKTKWGLAEVCVDFPKEVV